MTDERKRRGPSRFTQANVARAIKGAKQAGLEIAEVRIDPDGTIHIVPGAPGSHDDPSAAWDAKWGMPNSWDDKALAIFIVSIFTAPTPAMAWDTVIGRWCDRMLPQMPEMNREMTIAVDVGGNAHVLSRFANGKPLKQELTEAGGQIYRLTGSPEGERHRVVRSTGNLELIDNDGLIRVAERLENAPRKGDCLR